MRIRDVGATRWVALAGGGDSAEGVTALPLAAACHPEPGRPSGSPLRADCDWPSPPPLCDALLLGRVDYARAFDLQRALADERLAENIPDTLLLLEHEPVITLGRRGNWQHILAPPERLEALGVAVHRSSRGGLVTYHGPGQLVAYAITRLRGIAPGVPAYVYGLEEVIIRALADAGLEAWREPAHPGVWTGGGKIAAVGVALQRGITLHGVAVNLQPDLGHFALINPCGIGSLGVTSYLRERGRELDLWVFGRLLAERFGQVFGREMCIPASPEFSMEVPS